MSHPLLRAGPLTAAVTLRVLAADGVTERDLPTRGRVVRYPIDTSQDVAVVPGLRAKVATPALAAGEVVVAVTVDGRTYDSILDTELTAPALGSPTLDWRSTTYQLRDIA